MTTTEALSRSDELLARPEFSSPVPWPVSGLVRLCAANAVGLVAIGIGWYGSSGQASFDDTQVMWWNVAAGGVILAGLASAMWILHGRRMVGRKRELVLALLTHQIAARTASATRRAPILAEPAAVNGTATDDRSERLVTGPNMSKYHRSACVLVAAKAIREVPLTELATTQLDPCGVCTPLS